MTNFFVAVLFTSFVSHNCTQEMFKKGGQNGLLISKQGFLGSVFAMNFTPMSPVFTSLQFGTFLSP